MTLNLIQSDQVISPRYITMTACIALMVLLLCVVLTCHEFRSPHLCYILVGEGTCLKEVHPVSLGQLQHRQQ